MTATESKPSEVKIKLFSSGPFAYFRYGLTVLLVLAKLGMIAPASGLITKSWFLILLPAYFLEGISIGGVLALCGIAIVGFLAFCVVWFLTWAYDQIRAIVIHVLKRDNETPLAQRRRPTNFTLPKNW